MTDPRSPDRGAEPALQTSLDHAPKVATTTKSDKAPAAAPPAPPPDAEEVETMTGIPEGSQELSTI